jgi:hypothetical protein
LTAITLVVEMVQADPGCLEEFRNVCSPFLLALDQNTQSWLPGCPTSRSAPKIFGHDRIQPRARCFRYHGSFPPNQDTPAPPATWQRRLYFERDYERPLSPSELHSTPHTWGAGLQMAVTGSNKYRFDEKCRKLYSLRNRPYRLGH